MIGRTFLTASVSLALALAILASSHSNAFHFSCKVFVYVLR